MTCPTISRTLAIRPGSLSTNARARRGRLALTRAAVVSGSARCAGRSAVGRAATTAAARSAGADVVVVVGEAKSGAAVAARSARCPFISAGSAISAASFRRRRAHRCRAVHRQAIEGATAFTRRALRADVDAFGSARGRSNARVVLAEAAAAVAILGARPVFGRALCVGFFGFVLARGGVAIELAVAGATLGVVHARAAVRGARVRARARCRRACRESCPPDQK